MCRPRAALLRLALSAWIEPASAQVRVRPQSARGGEHRGRPWADVPEMFRHLKLPDWAVPTDLGRWREADGPGTRPVLSGSWAGCPPGRDPAKVEMIRPVEEHDGRSGA